MGIQGLYKTKQFWVYHLVLVYDASKPSAGSSKFRICSICLVFTGLGEQRHGATTARW